MAARRTRRPFVTTYHGAYNETNAFKKAYNAVMAKGDITIANSRYTAELIASRYGTPADRLRVIYRGVDGGAFDPAAIAPARIAGLRTAWGVGQDAPLVLHAARLTGWKGQSVVIEAARVMRERGTLAFLAGPSLLDLLLVLAGPITAIPLLLFAAALARLPLSSLGFMQYVSPSMQFLLAVLVFGEPFSRAQAGAFGLIWLALVLFALHTLRRGAAEPVMEPE